MGNTNKKGDNLQCAADILQCTVTPPDDALHNGQKVVQNRPAPIEKQKKG